LPEQGAHLLNNERDSSFANVPYSGQNPLGKPSASCCRCHHANSLQDLHVIVDDHW
jgi:hypothetical protein